MPPTTKPDAATHAPHRRWWLLLGVATVLAAVVAVALALFQPWKLWIDDEVDEAAPAGAVPITAPSATTAPPAPATSANSTVPSSTSPASTAPPHTVTPTTALKPTTTVAPTTAAASTTTAAAPTSAAAPTTTVAPAPVGGAFVGIDHGTSGTAVLLQEAGGAQFVRLQDLDTSNGPDLFVYLSTNPPDGPEGEFDDDYVDLGRLRGNLGSSNYLIPAGTDLARFASVVIWCDRFNSAFGAAPLR